MTLKDLQKAVHDGQNRKIIVAVDYGTTYSGLAWAQTARPEAQTTIIQWPDQNGSLEGETSDKVPSEHNYNDNGEVKWGFAVPEDEARYQWCKLDLDPQALDSVSHLSLEYPDPRAIQPGADANSVKLVSDYLRCLCNHTYEILKLKLGNGVVESTPLQFILTVPAIWSDAGKARTAECAKAAGMGDIQTISEPEAAVIYALDMMDPHNLKVGDKFVLCDAGGGTVDLISYSIEQLTPHVMVKETVKGDGDSCGSTFLNRIFADYLDETLGDDENWDDEIKETAMAHFEQTAKRKFTGEEKQIVVPVNGLDDDPSKGIKKGRMTIPASTVKTLFRPVISMITNLVKKQIKQTKNPKAVLVVGGFGQSAYLRKSIQQVVGRDIEVISPANGWTAVVRGALIRGLNDASPQTSRIMVKSRIARKHYGVTLMIPFDDDIHNPNRREWDGFNGRWSVECMDWLVKKGDNIDEKEAVVSDYYCTQLVRRGRFTFRTEEIQCFSTKSSKKAPLYPGKDVRKLVTLTSDLSRIPNHLIPTERGADGEEYYVLNFQIKVAFFSAHTEYSLWYKGVEYGKIHAEYV